jgi:large subunit ribosomal protein L10
MTGNIRPEKRDVVQDVKEKVQDASMIVFADYRGLSVSDMTELRQQLSEEQASLTVFKNTMMRIALSELEIEYPDEMLIGPSALVRAEGDPTKVSKLLVKYAKKKECFAIKGGIYEDSIIEDSVIIQLSQLPGREELIAKSVGLIKSPITNLVLCLSSPIQGLINALNAIKEKKQED